MSGSKWLASYDAAMCPVHQDELFKNLREFLQAAGKEIGATNVECIQHFNDLQNEAFGNKVPINLT